MPIPLRVLFGLSIVLALSGCNQGAPAEPTATASPPPVPTIVERVIASATPVVIQANPLAAVESKEITGVVVPAGAELKDYTPPTDSADARADYILGGVDLDVVRQWFLEQMPALGWDDGKSSDGSIIFLHTSQVSARYAREGLRRTATVHMEETDDGVQFTLLVEEPAEE